MAVIKLEGVDELQKRLKENVQLDDVKRVVKHNGSELQKRIKNKAVFKGHWGYERGKGRTFVKPSGATRDSVALEITDGGFAAEAGPTTEYAPYVELGTRFMQAQPFVRPAFEEQKKEFERDMKKLTR